ncbi:MAG: selenocysteine-specific translation elongation factor [Deltaproteobacteria bacterium]|nr:selenocysteine-specific translation elongation factor [Deltaproteobacteria bacterium]
MKHLVVGTAGHVDHGKTALIKRLTGVDTDRLKEEKERGITIELGFASLVLPGGRTLGVVDVPGHERFVRNMVAGAAGIDLVVLVIAADEGVMPQTREHLHICTLLGIRKGFVALTKIDMVDEEWLELVREDVRMFLRGTFLEDAPVVPVSSLTGAGFPDLLSTIGKQADEVEEGADVGLFRLPVDRVFTMKGFGTVVTGTLVSGKVGIGEEVEISPVGLRARVRGIQVHNRAVEAAEAGQRTAINLQGIDREAVERGHVLTGPGSLTASQRLDCIYRHLRGVGRKLKNRALVRFHAGTSEIMARMILLDRDELEPGQECCAQLVLETPLAAVAGDRFVVRSYSPVTTIGGGVIVDPLPAKHKRSSAGVLREFQRLTGGEDEGKTAVILERAGIWGITEKLLVVRTGIRGRELRRRLEGMFSAQRALLVDREEMRVLSYPVYEAFEMEILRELRGYHERNPLQEGLSREELRTTLERGDGIGQKIFTMALRDLEKRNEIIAEKELIRLTGHRVHLKGEMEDLRENISVVYRDGGLAPPTVREVLERFPERKKEVASLIQVMTREGVLIRISEDLNFHRDALAKLREDYRQLLIRDVQATPATFRELTGLSRKFIIPLMEYFDMTKLTMRTGDHRILRERPEK